MANELAAKFLLDSGNRKTARIYLLDARAIYQQWGANAEVHQLENNYSPLFANVPELTSPEISGKEIAPRSLIQTWTAVSEQKTPQGVIRKIMKIILEYSGASRGVVFFKHNDKLYAEFDVTNDIQRTYLLDAVAIEDIKDIPLPIIRYVENTKEPLLLGNAAQSGEYSGIPYIRENTIKSVYCFHLTPWEKQISIIYLENPFLENVFSPARIDFIKLIAAQMRISIENTNLRRDLEKRVKERTEELSHVNDLLQKEIIERIKANKKVEKSLNEKGILLREINHRVKNNLNMINIQEYLEDLIYTLFHTVSRRNTYVNLSSNIIDISIQTDTVITIGLVVTELVTNALKYAFTPKKKGVLTVSIEKEDKELVLSISDNGKGLPEDFSIEKSDILGITLTQALVQKLRGTLDIQSGNGTTFIVRFPFGS